MERTEHQAWHPGRGTSFSARTACTGTAGLVSLQQQVLSPHAEHPVTVLLGLCLESRMLVSTQTGRWGHEVTDDAITVVEGRQRAWQALASKTCPQTLTFAGPTQAGAGQMLAG